MKVIVTVGDVLNAAADVLICPANPWLNMSGGVNGAIREHCPEIQAELRAHLDAIGKAAVQPGTVVRTSASSLPFAHIIHTVAIDPFYDSTAQLVGKALTAAFDLATSLKACSVSLPTLATGYGPMSVLDFTHVFAESVIGHYDMDCVKLVVRTSTNADLIESVLAAATQSNLPRS